MSAPGQPAASSPCRDWNGLNLQLSPGKQSTASHLPSTPVLQARWLLALCSLVGGGFSWAPRVWVKWPLTEERALIKEAPLPSVGSRYNCSLRLWISKKFLFCSGFGYIGGNCRWLEETGPVATAGHSEVHGWYGYSETGHGVGKPQGLRKQGTLSQLQEPLTHKVGTSDRVLWAWVITVSGEPKFHKKNKWTFAAWGHWASIYLTSEKSLQFSFERKRSLPHSTLVHVLES